MALIADRRHIQFGYIHVVSDNVARVQAEHLGNEREAQIIRKRLCANFRILEILALGVFALNCAILRHSWIKPFEACQIQH